MEIARGYGCFSMKLTAGFYNLSLREKGQLLFVQCLYLMVEMNSTEVMNVEFNDVEIEYLRDIPDLSLAKITKVQFPFLIGIPKYSCIVHHIKYSKNSLVRVVYHKHFKNCLE